MTADFGHVGGHDAIAALGHDRHLGARPFRRHAHSQKGDAERLCHFAQLRQMRHELGRGLVHGLDRGARQFELPAGLQRDRAASGDVEKADDFSGFDDRFPAEQHLHAL